MIEAFLKYIQFEKRLSPHTVTAYANDLLQFSSFIKAEFDERNPEQANYSIIRSWIANLAEDGLDSRSINRKVAALRAFYKYLLRSEVIDKDPMIKVKALKTSKKLPSFVKAVEMPQVLDTPDEAESHFASIRNRLILEILYATGIRVSELVNLKDSAIDRRALTIKVLGKRNKERIIPFHKKLLQAIDEYLNVRNREITPQEPRHLLVTERGAPVNRSLVYKVVNRQLRKHSTVDKKSPHVLRHTFATHLLDKGAEINAVKDLLGHASLAATQVYTHNSMEKIKKTFEQAHPKA